MSWSGKKTLNTSPRGSESSAQVYQNATQYLWALKYNIVVTIPPSSPADKLRKWKNIGIKLTMDETGAWMMCGSGCELPLGA
jgi:hypothetical protein